MQIECDTRRWAQKQFGGCELGDTRRTRRVVKLAAQLSAQAGSSPLKACEGDSAASEGAYRLLRNDAVSPQAIAQGGFEATVRAAREVDELLAIEDTTTLSYTHAVAEELGDLGGPVATTPRGFWVHSVLLVDAHSGHTVGLVEQSRWCRETRKRGQREARKRRAYESKESVKWQRSSEVVSARLGETMGRVISVCDREADVYEYLQYKTRQAQRYVVRASWDRRVHGEARHLFEALEQAPEQGRYSLALAQRGGTNGRRARQAHLRVRSARAALRAPQRDASLGSLEVNAVLVQEHRTPRGQEPVCWLLLTSEPVDSIDAARRVIDHYARRWRVEEFHKAWKSGTGVEHRRMQSPHNLERIAVVLAFVAVRLLQLREVLENDSAALPHDTSCAGVLSTEEWQVLWLTRQRTAPPTKPPPLRWAYEAIAKLGGWIDTKRTGRAGWETMWHGWFRLQERVDAYLLTRDFI